MKSQQIFTIPFKGTYYVSTTLFKHTPTDKFEMRPNPKRKWFQFWKPKYTMQRVYKTAKIDAVDTYTELYEGLINE